MNTTDGVQATADPVAPDESARGERVRTRWIVGVTAVLTVLVMGAVIALGLDRQDEGLGRVPRDRGEPYSAADIYGPGGHAEPAPVDDGCPTDPEHPPRIRFDLPPGGIDFGAVKQGVKMTREVVFRNEGTGPLCIRKVAEGCGCMKADIIGETRRFEPGEEGRIEVTLDTKSKEGLLKKTVTVYTNAVDVPLKKFVARASVTLGMRLSSSFVNFGRVTAGRSATVRVRMRTPKTDRDWEVTAVESTQEVDGVPFKYGWRVEEIADARDLVREIVIEHPGLETEDTSFQDRIVVRTTHPDRAEFTLRAHLLVVKPILAVPRRAVLGFVPSNLPPPRIKLVPGDPEVVFQVTDVSFEMHDGSPIPAEGCGFTATRGADADGAPWIEVRYDGQKRRGGPIRAVLVVHTDLDRLPEVRIDCYATVQ